MVKNEEEARNEELAEIYKQDLQDIPQEDKEIYMPNEPYDKLGYQFKVTEPSYGKESEYSPEVMQKFNKKIGSMTKDEVDYDVVKNMLLNLQAIFKRDLRLGNISRLSGDHTYCEARLNFAYKCLNHDCPQAALLVMEEAISKLEISQSINGFFRQNEKSFYKSEKKEIKDPADKTLFGATKEGI